MSIKFFKSLLLFAATVFLAILSVIDCHLYQGQAWAALPALENSIKVNSIKINKLERAEVNFPPFARKEGKIVVLRFKAYISSPAPRGCNWNLAMRVNGEDVRQSDSDGNSRMLSRDSGLTLMSGAQNFPIFKGKNMMLFYAPNAEIADRLTTDKLGASFCLDISDLVRGVDGNSITFENMVNTTSDKAYGYLMVENIELGYMNANVKKLSKTTERTPERKRVALGIKTTTFELAQSNSGGFVVRLANGTELLAETTLGINPEASSRLIADDSVPKNPAVKSVTKISGDKGFAIRAGWGDIALSRTLEIKDDILVWKEEWTNTGRQTIAVPFHHYVFLRNENSHYYIGGTDLVNGLETSPGNPTIFIQSTQREGVGLGVTAESDWLRLLMGLAVRKGVGEIYSNSLGLGPGKSIKFELTVTPVVKNGYWGFINSVRNRWQVNGVTVKRPIFWTYKKARIAGSQEDIIKASLGHLGPITLCITPWQRLQPDASEIRAGAYPRLPAGRSVVPGGSPDLDIASFLTFKHREKYWGALRREVELIRKAIPDVKVIEMMHPAMEVVYKPLKERWPIASDRITGQDGTVFESSVFSKAWLGDMTTKDWGVLYYAPKVGSPQLENILLSMRRGLDEIGLDGMYVDEFSFAGINRGYDRYDYNRPDSYSVDLDEKGRVLRSKSDNAFVTEPAQVQIVNEIRKRNKIFLGNTPPASRALNNMPVFRFAEGGNGPHLMPSMHLSASPLILGNMSDNSSLKEIIADVRECLRLGLIYSPKDINLLLPDDKNFVSKFYPITVREIGQGWVIGDERIATVISGSYNLPNRKSNIYLYRYDETGRLIERKTATPAIIGRLFRVDVPERGMVIAEFSDK